MALPYPFAPPLKKQKKNPTMSQGSKAEALREALRIAKLLRQHVADTSDTHYIELFLETADALEARAIQLANGDGAPAPQYIDLRC
jgi:hypothetical protein